MNTRVKRSFLGATTIVVQICALFLTPGLALALVPNDPQLNLKGGVESLQLPQAWDISQGSSDVIVAVIDAGVDITNPDLAENVWLNPREQTDGVDNDGNGLIDDVRGWNFVKNNGDVRPSALVSESSRIGLNHGSVIAGIIGAVGNNGKGGSGVNWRVKILPLKILDERGEGDTDLAVKAIDYAIQKKASIINLSFVGPTPSLDFIQAVRRAYRAGILVIAAAGNAPEGMTGTDLNDSPQYPVCFDDPLKEENWVIGVAALAEDGRLAPFSNFGNKCIDIAAPGSRVPSTVLYDAASGNTDIYGGGWSGTSIAAPFVSGVAALVKSVQPKWGPDEIRKALFDTVDPIPGNITRSAGLGSVNAFKAVRYAEQGGDGGLAKGFYIAPVKTGKGVVAHVLDTQFKETKSFAVAPAGAVDVQITTGDTQASGVAQIIATTSNNKGSLVRYFQRDGKLTKEFRPFGNKERGTMPVYSADVDGNGADEIVVGSNKLRQALILEGNGKVRGTIVVPEKKGSIYVAADRLPDRSVVVTAVQQGKQVIVYVWDQFGTYLSDFVVPLESTTPISIGFAPAENGSKRFYIAQQTQKNVKIYYSTLDGLVTQVISAAPVTGKVYGFAFGKAHEGENSHLVLGVSHGSSSLFETVDTLGEISGVDKIDALRSLKFTALYFGK
jgi:subtilisin family serine protease